jgi:hypothetical protein
MVATVAAVLRIGDRSLMGVIDPKLPVTNVRFRGNRRKSLAGKPFED